MPKQEDGNWKPYNVQAIVSSVARVLQTGDIENLTKPVYDFIIGHMGFIAHYSLDGFQCEYRNPDEFRKTLQTSEYSRDPNHNSRWADRYESDLDFNKWYGAAYCRSVSETIRGIIKAARFQQPSLLSGMDLKK